MIVTFAAGGSSDVLARAVATAMSQGLGKQIIIENRPGAGGNIGAEAAAKATPDGYTLLFGTNGTLGIGPALYKNLRYDPQKDLVPVGMLHQLPLVLIVNPQVPAQNLGELIAYAKKNPGKLTFASAGVGSASHLTAELFKQRGRHRYPARALQGRRRGNRGPDFRSGVDDAGNHSERAAACTRRPDAGARRDHARALGQCPGHSDLCGIRPAEFRCRRLDRLVRAGGHAEGRDRPAQCRDGADRERSGSTPPRSGIWAPMSQAPRPTRSALSSRRTSPNWTEAIQRSGTKAE